MANEQIFTTKAEEYAHSRPSYAPEAIAKIFRELLQQGDVVADIGSGTGILSREFLIRGYEVYCVEPNDAMRLEAEKRYHDWAIFHSIAATAEQTSLPAQSVALITAASAFHWFDAAAFRRECERLLTPHGAICILANERVYDAFTEKQHTLCRRYCLSYTSLTHGMEKVLRQAQMFFKGEFTQERFSFPLSYSKDRFISRSLSSSYAPEKGSAQYEAYVCALRELLDQTFHGEMITIANETVMLWGRVP